MVTIGPLTPDQRRELTELRQRAVGRVAMRAQMVLLSAKGYAVAEIAAMFDVSEGRVRRWVRRYQQEGAAGLEDRPRPGRPPKDRLARQIVDAQASAAPRNSGLVRSCWTVGLLARFGLALSPSSVRRYLKAADSRWARPRLDPASHAPGRQRKIDPATPVKLKLIKAVLASDATLLYLDESELQLLPLIRALWMKGPRVRIPTPGQNARRTIFG